MIKQFFISLITVSLILLSACEDPFVAEPEPEPEPDTEPPYASTEAKIRARFDNAAVFPWNQYTQLLTVLSDDKYVVLPLNEMRMTYNSSKVVVGLRHDVDFNAFKALEMVEMEKSFGIRATYFILATSEYYGYFDGRNIVRNKGMDQLYLEISRTGAEIGIHNDLLTVMIQYKLDPLVFNKNELAFYSDIGIHIHGTASHGSPLSREISTINYRIFSDFALTDSVEYKGKKYPLGEHSLSDYEFEYEAYFIDYKYYYSDSGGKWNVPGGYNEILQKLESSVPGDRIQILVHPDWWGKK